MTSSQPLVDEKSAAFTRLAARVIGVLNEAVEYRKEQGESLTSIADRLGWHRSALSRVLNGTTRNITLRTVSEVLWATEFEPEDFKAEPIEKLSSNWMPQMNVTVIDDQLRVAFPVQTIGSSSRQTSDFPQPPATYEIEQVAL